MRIALATVVMGLLLNAWGWAGNVFLLGDLWERAAQAAPPPLTSPFPGLARELASFVSDFVFAFVWTCIYALILPAWRRSPMGLAWTTALLVWLGGVPMTYLGVVNSGYLPSDVAVATSLLALAGFVILAPLMPRLLPARRA